MPDTTGYTIRMLDKAEATLASNFSRVNGRPFEAVTVAYCVHHHATILICLSPGEGVCEGLLISYISPSNPGTAVIDAMIFTDSSIKDELAVLMLQYGMQYFKNRCVFTIEASGTLHGDFPGLLESQLFKQVDAEPVVIYRRKLLPDKICLHNRRMRPKMNTINGEVSEETLFEYFQKDNIVWGTYSGGTIQRGVLIGRMAKNGDCQINYLQLNNGNEINTGVSQSATEFLNDGRIILYEDWEWTGNKTGGGRSVIEEIKE
ncbi:MAG: hypothetical protein V4717_07675 [Bacteroidota bacterium]